MVICNTVLKLNILEKENIKLYVFWLKDEDFRKVCNKKYDRITSGE